MIQTVSYPNMSDYCAFELIYQLGIFSKSHKMEKSEYTVTSNELKNQFDIPIQLFLSCIGYQ